MLCKCKYKCIWICICPYIYTHMYIHIHKYFLIPTWIKHASTIRNSTDIAFLKYICGEMSVFSQGWHAQLKKCLHGIIRRPAWPLLKDDMHKTFVLTFILAQENLAAARWRLTWFRSFILFYHGKSMKIWKLDDNWGHPYFRKPSHGLPTRIQGGPVNVRFKHWDNGVWDGLGQNSTAKAG